MSQQFIVNPLARMSNQENQPRTFGLFLSIAVQRASILAGLRVAIVVGTVVNLINQGEHLMGLHFAQVSWPKLMITFCIPFLVSIYNGTTTRLRFDPGVRAAINAKLTCKKCAHSMDVYKDEIVPDCPKCGTGSRWKRRVR